MASRPAVPNDVKRQLRQEAGFGCCACGHPFIEYHHIIPYSEERHFRADDMMVLCPNHHHLCTADALSEAEQRKLKNRPKNIVDDLVRGVLFVNTGRLEVELAGGRAINTPRLLTFRGQEILGARLSDDNRLLISSVIQNPKGEVIARLVENEWQVVPSAVWDFEVGPQKATVRSAAREIAFEVDTRNDKAHLRGQWFLGGEPIVFSPSGATIGKTVIRGMVSEDCGGFISLD
jgi:hypothetical protein